MSAQRRKKNQARRPAGGSGGSKGAGTKVADRAKGPRGEVKPTGKGGKGKARPSSKSLVSRAQRRRRTRTILGWSAFLLLVIVVAVLATVLDRGKESNKAADAENFKPYKAPAVQVEGTDGSKLELPGIRGTRRGALLYFNEGAMCDTCMVQAQQLEAAADKFEKKGVRVITVVPDSRDHALQAMQQWGVKGPIYIDPGNQASEAYKVIGLKSQMMPNMPGHTFLYVDSSGTVRWLKDYPSMRASVDELLSAIPS